MRLAAEETDVRPEHSVKSLIQDDPTLMGRWNTPHFLEDAMPGTLAGRSVERCLAQPACCVLRATPRSRQLAARRAEARDQRRDQTGHRLRRDDASWPGFGDAAAAQGFRTIAFDADAALIGRLQRGELPVSEELACPNWIELHQPASANATFMLYGRALLRWQVNATSSTSPSTCADRRDEAQSDLTPIRVMVERVRPKLGATAVRW